MSVAPRRGVLRGLGRSLKATIGPSSATYHELLREELQGSRTILDVGCGFDSPLQILRGTGPRLVGVDQHEPTLAQAALRGTHDEYVHGDALSVLDRFGPQSFDAVVALDVIEHFEKPVGIRFLETLECMARHKVVIFTPNGFLPQGEQHGNPWQVHRAGWEAEEFRSRGYRVLGINGWRALRTERAAVRLWPNVLGHLACRLTQLVTFGRPEFAFQLLAVRHLGRG